MKFWLIYLFVPMNPNSINKRVYTKFCIIKRLKYDNNIKQLNIKLTVCLNMHKI